MQNRWKFEFICIYQNIKLSILEIKLSIMMTSKEIEISLTSRKEMWLLKNLKNVVFSLKDTSVFYFNLLNILTYF